MKQHIHIHIIIHNTSEATVHTVFTTLMKQHIIHNTSKATYCIHYTNEAIFTTLMKLYIHYTIKTYMYSQHVTILVSVYPYSTRTFQANCFLQ